MDRNTKEDVKKVYNKLKTRKVIHYSENTELLKKTKGNIISSESSYGIEEKNTYDEFNSKEQNNGQREVESSHDQVIVEEKPTIAKRVLKFEEELAVNKTISFDNLIKKKYESQHSIIDINTVTREELGTQYNVPADGNCLFWSIFYAYLLPVRKDHEEFKGRLKKMFPGDSDWYNVSSLQNKFQSRELNLDTQVKDFIPLIQRLRMRAYNEVKISIDKDKIHVTPSKKGEKHKQWADRMANAQYDNDRKIPMDYWGEEKAINALAYLLDIKIKEQNSNQQYPCNLSNLLNQKWDQNLLPVKSNIEIILLNTKNHYNFYSKDIQWDEVDNTCASKMDNIVKTISDDHNYYRKEESTHDEFDNKTDYSSKSDSEQESNQEDGTSYEGMDTEDINENIEKNINQGNTNNVGTIQLFYNNKEDYSNATKYFDNIPKNNCSAIWDYDLKKLIAGYIILNYRYNQVDYPNLFRIITDFINTENHDHIIQQINSMYSSDMEDRLLFNLGIILSQKEDYNNAMKYFYVVPKECKLYQDAQKIINDEFDNKTDYSSKSDSEQESNQEDGTSYKEEENIDRNNPNSSGADQSDASKSTYDEFDNKTDYSSKSDSEQESNQEDGTSYKEEENIDRNNPNSSGADQSDASKSTYDEFDNKTDYSSKSDSEQESNQEDGTSYKEEENIDRNNPNSSGADQSDASKSTYDEFDNKTDYSSKSDSEQESNQEDGTSYKEEENIDRNNPNSSGADQSDASKSTYDEFDNKTDYSSKSDSEQESNQEDGTSYKEEENIDRNNPNSSGADQSDASKSTYDEFDNKTDYSSKSDSEQESNQEDGTSYKEEENIDRNNPNSSGADQSDASKSTYDEFDNKTDYSSKSDSEQESNQEDGTSYKEEENIDRNNPNSSGADQSDASKSTYDEFDNKTDYSSKSDSEQESNQEDGTSYKEEENIDRNNPNSSGADQSDASKSTYDEFDNKTDYSSKSDSEQESNQEDGTSYKEEENIDRNNPNSSGADQSDASKSTYDEFDNKTDYSSKSDSEQESNQEDGTSYEEEENIDRNQSDNNSIDEKYKLYDAVKKGNIPVVKDLLTKGVNINDEVLFGYTVLHSGVKEGHTDVIKLLLNKGADVNAKTERAYTALHLGVQEGYTNIVKLLLNKGADVNAKDLFGYTALHLGVKEGHTDVIKLLLNKGADVNAKDLFGYTALHLGVKEGHTDVIKLLLNKGADVNAKTENGCTALCFTVKNEYKDTIKLLSNSLYEQAVYHNSISIAKNLLKSKIPVDIIVQSTKLPKEIVENLKKDNADYIIATNNDKELVTQSKSPESSRNVLDEEEYLDIKYDVPAEDNNEFANSNSFRSKTHAVNNMLNLSKCNITNAKENINVRDIKSTVDLTKDHNNQKITFQSELSSQQLANNYAVPINTNNNRGYVGLSDNQTVSTTNMHRNVVVEVDILPDFIIKELDIKRISKSNKSLGDHIIPFSTFTKIITQFFQNEHVVNKAKYFTKIFIKNNDQNIKTIVNTIENCQTPQEIKGCFIKLIYSIINIWDQGLTTKYYGGPKTQKDFASEGGNISYINKNINTILSERLPESFGKFKKIIQEIQLNFLKTIDLPLIIRKDIKDINALSEASSYIQGILYYINLRQNNKWGLIKDLENRNIDTKKLAKIISIIENSDEHITDHKNIIKNLDKVFSNESQFMQVKETLKEDIDCLIKQYFKEIIINISEHLQLFNLILFMKTNFCDEIEGDYQNFMNKFYNEKNLAKSLLDKQKDISGERILLLKTVCFDETIQDLYYSEPTENTSNGDTKCFDITDQDFTFEQYLKNIYSNSWDYDISNIKGIKIILDRLYKVNSKIYLYDNKDKTGYITEINKEVSESVNQKIIKLELTEQQYVDSQKGVDFHVVIIRNNYKDVITMSLIIISQDHDNKVLTKELNVLNANSNYEKMINETQGIWNVIPNEKYEIKLMEYSISNKGFFYKAPISMNEVIFCIRKLYNPCDKLRMVSDQDITIIDYNAYDNPQELIIKYYLESKQVLDSSDSSLQENIEKLIDDTFDKSPLEMYADYLLNLYQDQGNIALKLEKLVKNTYTKASKIWDNMQKITAYNWYKNIQSSSSDNPIYEGTDYVETTGLNLETEPFL